MSCSSYLKIFFCFGKSFLDFNYGDFKSSSYFNFKDICPSAFPTIRRNLILPQNMIIIYVGILLLFILSSTFWFSTKFQVTFSGEFLSFPFTLVMTSWVMMNLTRQKKNHEDNPIFMSIYFSLENWLTCFFFFSVFSYFIYFCSFRWLCTIY